MAPRKGEVTATMNMEAPIISDQAASAVKAMPPSTRAGSRPTCTAPACCAAALNVPTKYSGPTTVTTQST